MATTPIIDLAEYKSLMGVQSADTRDDAQVGALIPAASRAVRSYTGRSFDSDTTTGERAFQYDGTGYLDIDDCVEVTHVATDGGMVGQEFNLTPDMYTVMPQDGSLVFYYIILNAGPFGVSPEMGFERNLDTIGIRPKSPVVTVTGTWGWPEIPEDVKLATALTVSELMSARGPGGRGEGMTAEAIEGWSRSWNRGSNAVSLAIPNRARDLLVNYQRVFV